jgi:hypothetical protein
MCATTNIQSISVYCSSHVQSAINYRNLKQYIPEIITGKKETKLARKKLNFGITKFSFFLTSYYLWYVLL